MSDKNKGFIESILESIRIFFSGKKIAILGTIETGKTTMHKFLRDGEIVTNHVATRRQIDVDKSIFKVDNYELLIKKGKDISGQRTFLSEWKDLYIDCNVCFYMFNASKVYTNDKAHIEEIYANIAQFGEWNNELKNKPQVLMIGSHADYIKEYQEANKSNIQVIDKIIRENLKKAYLLIDLKPSNIFIASLTTPENINELMRDILKSFKF
jgi:hypothetical protein